MLFKPTVTFGLFLWICCEQSNNSDRYRRRVFALLAPVDYHIGRSLPLEKITAMLLISCPECRREISGRPDLCPNCGVPLGEVVLKRCKSWLRIGKTLAGFGTVLVILSMIDNVRSPFGPVGWLLVVVGLVLTIWAQYTSRQPHS